MLKNFLTLYFLLCVSIICISQTADDTIDWNKLQSVDFQQKYVAEVKMEMLFPKFTSSLKSLNGTIVQISGFVVPFDKTGAKIVLSANSYASCFFCGKAGPASVMTINLKIPNKKYRTDQFRTFKGKLRLNESDIREFYYILDGAQEVK